VISPRRTPSRNRLVKYHQEILRAAGRVGRIRRVDALIRFVCLQQSRLVAGGRTVATACAICGCGCCLASGRTESCASESPFWSRAEFTHARPNSDSLNSAHGMVYRAGACYRVIGRPLLRWTQPMRRQGSRNSCCPQSVREFRYCAKPSISPGRPPGLIRHRHRGRTSTR
jgi:hypothetical protein